MTLAKNSIIFSLFDGVRIPSACLAQLHGYCVHDLDLSTISDCQFKQLLGNGIHLGVAGAGLMTLLSAVLSG